MSTVSTLGTASTGGTARPLLVDTVAALGAHVATARAAGRSVALVPTMGALHEGHASLARLARARVDDGLVVASVFVNPLQFGAGEDLDRYPRTLDADLEVCGAAGVDVVFAPSVDEVYPGGPPQVGIDPGPLADRLEGASRPGHFAGVCVVVAKLLGLVQPDLAVFGEKDYQQLAVVRRMVRDLSVGRPGGAEIVGAETVRDPDGLALSSRNRYLDADQRRAALALSRALRRAQEVAAASPAGEAAAAAHEAASAVLAQEPGVDVDYLVVTDPALDDLPPDPAPGTPARVLVAARVGTTRLLDNLPLTLG